MRLKWAASLSLTSNVKKRPLLFLSAALIEDDCDSEL